MWSVLSEWWPFAALLVPGGAVDASALLVLVGGAAVLLVAVLVAAACRPLSAGLRASGSEAFAVVRVRLRASDPRAEGHVRSRAPGAGG